MTEHYFRVQAVCCRSRVQAVCCRSLRNHRRDTLCDSPEILLCTQSTPPHEPPEGGTTNYLTGHAAGLVSPAGAEEYRIRRLDVDRTLTAL
ncbi:MAG: hypothetical protein B6245_23445 [Desulfobacteraceae bacterium 4572_88]|nr:MAG: hypothetical protein B6245_23445 [Desulfobacteraceae bacterium 4572_88]